MIPTSRLVLRGALNVASPNSDYREPFRSSSSDVMIEGKLANFVSLGHRGEDTPVWIWIARRHEVAG